VVLVGVIYGVFSTAINLHLKSYVDNIWVTPAKSPTPAP